jgi:hypothetical protein
VPNHALDSHPAAVASILAESRVVPFLDAGVNCAGLAPGVVWEQPGRELPTAGELADKASLEEHHSDLARVSKYTEATLGRPELNPRIRQVVVSESRITAVHEFLASLPRRLRSAEAVHRDH